eukprot:TRINITY_DN7429_c0_g1_i1.p1 TRINITY_DN7429_c0_g1~~TRINITY_DN7429_c0_g1_i1.p1  ORF type:complete len:393 (-),score=49.61 TRINITY_DN7429_c0_g1_i1:254-1390(-)
MAALSSPLYSATISRSDRSSIASCSGSLISCNYKARVPEGAVPPGRCGSQQRPGRWMERARQPNMQLASGLQSSNQAPEIRRQRAVTTTAASNVQEGLTEAANSEALTRPAGVDAMQLTYLEGNSWHFEVAGIGILVDPIIGMALDFSVPWLYSATKIETKDLTLDDLPPYEVLLITQGFDDHCHLNTLRPLFQKRPDLPVIASPNAEGMLQGLFPNVTYLEPGETTDFTGSNGEVLTVKATAGPVLGPPWQRPENGYVVRSQSTNGSLYLEPHCVYKPDVAAEAPVQVVITPVVKQQLPAFTLVSGQEDAAVLAKLLQAQYVVSMANAELNATGPLSVLVQPVGTAQSFQKILSEKLPSAKFLEPKPGFPLPIPPPN